MSLEKKIEADIKVSMKEKNVLKLSTLRMLKAEFENVKLDQNKKELNDGEVTKVIQRQVKTHRDSIDQFEKGKRDDLVEKEKKELDILLSYLPRQMSEEDLKKIVAETIKELGATTKKDMGRVIKTVIEKTKGKTEGKAVSQIVSSILK